MKYEHLAHWTSLFIIKTIEKQPETLKPETLSHEPWMCFGMKNQVNKSEGAPSPKCISSESPSALCGDPGNSPSHFFLWGNSLRINLVACRRDSYQEARHNVIRRGKPPCGPLLAIARTHLDPLSVFQNHAIGYIACVVGWGLGFRF